MFEENSLRGLFLALCVGLSTIAGALIICFIRDKSEKIVAISLGFAAGVMISATFTDLFPEAEEMLSAYAGGGRGVALSVLFLIVGLVFAALMDRIIPHDHGHHVRGGDGVINDGENRSNLYHIGIVTAVAIGLHNFPEGMALYMAGYEDATLGAAIAVAIALHNIPGGISVASPIYYATGSRKKALLYTLLAGLCEPLGALFACLLLRPLINDAFLGAIFGIVSGVLLYIALEELLPAARNRGYDRHALVAVFAGICLMPLTHAFHMH
ncbi:MAG: zinc transporter ZupT [Oscillospiraceae bacterium]|jgi:ZIP family zinc transporter|nr:zinc transporter ZupT [Oscillospiraceae bacterium]